MRALLLVPFLLAAACGGGGGGGSPGPQITSVDPAPGASLGEPPTSITVRFDRPINTDTVNESTFVLSWSGGDGILGNGNDVTLFAFTLDFPDARTAVLDLSTIPLPEEIYRLRLVGSGNRRILDQDGFALDGEYSGSFPTGNGSAGGDFVMSFRATTSVEAMTPAPGSSVSPPAAVVLRLSPDVDPATVDAATFRIVRAGGDSNFTSGNEVGIVAASITQTSPGEFRFDLAGNALPADAYQVTLAGSDAGGALRFDGTDDIVRAPPSSELRPGAGDWTVECWVVIEDPARADGMVECADGDFSNGWRLGHEAGGSFVFAVDGATATRTAAGGPAPTALAWHHVAGVYDAALGETRLYVDGALAATDAAGDAGAITPAAALFLGRNGTVFLRGSLDEVRLWSDARTGEEIRRDRYRRLTGNEPGLRVYWRFDADFDQFVIDATTPQNTGSLGVDFNAGSDDPVRRLSTAWPFVRDLDGDPLDGTFTGTLPAGVGAPGEDFVATFRLR